MTKLSRLHLDPEHFGHYVNNLWAAFTLMDSKEDIRLLFKDLFTHTEYKMFAKRLEIARRLLQGQTYEEIINALRVTSRTINNVSNILVIHGDGLRKVHSKLQDLEHKYQGKREERQAILERRVRRKAPAETFLANLVTEGVPAANRFIRKKLKQRSAKRTLEG
ncbi:MAG: hypothetical protein HYW51_02935 [Candidatus Doudnabacteria bacterium]|nr:hypothetical protein [Candidatus Doudnabacteria bacterium]